MNSRSPKGPRQAHAPDSSKRGKPSLETARAADAGGPDDSNRRPELIRAAARLFREKGFDGTTVRDIAAAVGMRSGSPFYHFASKQEMLQVVMHEGLRQGLERMEAVLAQKLAPRQRFSALVRTHLGIILERGNDFIPVMLYDWQSLDEGHRREIIAMKDRYDTVWQSMTRELARSGLLRGDPKVARLMVLGAMNFTATWYRSGGALSLDALADEVVTLFLNPEPANG